MAEINVNQRIRIRVNKKHEAAIKLLINSKLFQTRGEVIVASSIVGYNAKAYEPDFEDNASDRILMNQFNDRCYDIINFLAYARTQQQSVLKDGDNFTEKYTIFEGYANGGFPILLEKLGVDINNLQDFDQLEMLQKYYQLLKTGSL